MKPTAPQVTRRQVLRTATAIAAYPAVPSAAQSSEDIPSLGNLFAPVREYSRPRTPRYSFLDPHFRDLESWKREARAAYRDRLAYEPSLVPFDAHVVSTNDRNGYTEETLVFRASAYSEVPAVFLRPAKPLPGRPGLVALHDHGGFYYYGKEKIIENDSEPAVLTDFKQRIYGDRSYASEFARAGFAVLAIDAFYFGGRRLDPATLPAGRADSLREHAAGSDAYIEAYNRFAGSYETLMAKTIFLSGTTWPGMILFDDLRSVDYLKTRPEVNPDRIGCVGLSGGGLRSALLCGMHPDIRSAVVCCFMSTAEAMLPTEVEHHTWMMYVPRVYDVLDLPDVASLTAPNRLLVQYGRQDALFTLKGQEDSASKLEAIFRKAECPDHFRASFHDVPHGFFPDMQAEALEWFQQNLVEL